LDQSVRIRTQAFGGMRPCFLSQLLIQSTVRRKSASFFASSLQFKTDAGPTKRSGGMLSVAFCGRSLPEIQWTGASKCVPVCSPQEKLFQYQAGPALVVARHLLDPERPRLPISGGRLMCGNSGESVCVRSTTRSFRRKRPERSSPERS
jgi:hypothetical protein